MVESGSTATAMWKPLAWRKPRLVEHDADVAFPEHEVAAGEGGGGRPLPFAEPVPLHVGIARRRAARRLDGELEEGGTVQPVPRLAAPQVWCADVGFGDLHPVGPFRDEGAEMLAEDEAVRPVQPVEDFLARQRLGDRNACAERKMAEEAGADRGAGEDQRVRNADPVRRRDLVADHLGTDVADIAVRRALDPRPAVRGLEHVDRLACKELGLAVVGAGLAEHRRDGHCDRAPLGLRVARGVDGAGKAHVREVVADGVKAGVEAHAA